MYVPQDAIELANLVLEIATEHDYQIAAAESCTSGMISATLTEIRAPPEPLTEALSPIPTPLRRTC